MGIVSLFLLRRRIIIDKLSQCGAFSEETAKTFSEAGIINTDAYPYVIDKLIKHGIINKTNDGKYYLNK